jgi:hypothetical protein
LYLCRDTIGIYSITTYVNNSTGTYSLTVPSGLVSGNNYRIRIANYSYSAIRAYSSAFSISGINPDAYEPDDSVSIAHSITINTPENHTFPTSDVDWFTFTAKTNYMYIVQVTSRIYPTVTIYSTDKTSVLGTTSSTVDSTLSTVLISPISGAAYFRITASSTGSYRVNLVESDSSQYRFQVTSPAASATVALSSSCSIQWQSTVNFGGSVDIFLCNTLGVPQLTIATSVTNNGSYSWTVPASGLSGSYYIKVSSRINASLYGNSGTFTIQ